MLSSSQFSSAESLTKDWKVLSDTLYDQISPTKPHTFLISFPGTLTIPTHRLDYEVSLCKEKRLWVVAFSSMFPSSRVTLVSDMFTFFLKNESLTACRKTFPLPLLISCWLMVSSQQTLRLLDLSQVLNVPEVGTIQFSAFLHISL